MPGVLVVGSMTVLVAVWGPAVMCLGRGIGVLVAVSTRAVDHGR
jgi:hypothetical protein